MKIFALTAKLDFDSLFKRAIIHGDQPFCKP